MGKALRGFLSTKLQEIAGRDHDKVPLTTEWTGYLAGVFYCIMHSTC